MSGAVAISPGGTGPGSARQVNECPLPGGVTRLGNVRSWRRLEPVAVSAASAESTCLTNAAESSPYFVQTYLMFDIVYSVETTIKRSLGLFGRIGTFFLRPIDRSVFGSAFQVLQGPRIPKPKILQKRIEGGSRQKSNAIQFNL